MSDEFLGTYRPERIGKVGILWATKYKDGWTVYKVGEGVVVERLTKREAERIVKMTKKEGSNG